MKRPHLALVISIKPEQHLHMKTQKVDCISLPGELQDLTTPSGAQMKPQSMRV